MTVCKVLLLGLKPSEISTSTKDDTISESLSIKSNSSSPSDNDYLNVDIKPLLTPANSRSSISSDNNRDSSPIHVMIRATSRGRHRICISQTILRPHNGGNV